MTKPNPTECYVDGYDPDGIPRVWGSGPDATGAMDQARLAASEYIATKYSKGWSYVKPITDWSFKERDYEAGVAFKDNVSFKYWTGTGR